MEILNIPEAI